jgi:tetratricopeptide (TPR) repeat protein
MNAKDHPALQFAAIASMQQADWDKAAKYLQQAEDSPYGGHSKDKLLESWNAILGTKVTDSTLSALDSGNIGSTLEQSSEYLYTLALTQLFDGKPDDGRRTYTLALEKEDPNHISAMAWLVQAEIMKQYSLEDVATLAFQNAESARNFGELDCAEFLLRRDAKRSGSAPGRLQ